MMPYKEIWSRRELIWFLVESQSKSTLHHTWFGSLWYVLLPLATAATYYFLIVIVFGRGDTYAAGTFLTLLVGIMHYHVLLNVVTYGLPAIYNNENILVQLKIDPAVFIGAGFLRGLRISLFGLGVSLVFWFFWAPAKSWAIIAYPFVLVLWFCVCWVIVFNLGILAPFFRDLERLVPILLTLAMYFCPVLYTSDMLPDIVRGIYEFNPFTFIFTSLQWSLLGGGPPSLLALASLIGFLLLSIGVSTISYEFLRPKITKSF